MLRTLLSVLAAFGMLLPLSAGAQSTSMDGPWGEWRYQASIYGYFPSLRGSSSQPASGGGSIQVDAGKIIDALKFTFMGSIEAHNGRWGLFTDFVYLELDGEVRNSRDFTIGGGAIPAGTTARLGWDLQGTVWTLAGQYRVASDPGLTADVLAGVRMFRLNQAQNWDITGNLGSLPPSGRTGQASQRETLADALVGVKGRYAFGASRRWSIPFYIDIGAGESRRTWQAGTGVSYAFSWGDVALLYRQLGYDFKAGTSLSFSGPMIGATFKF